ncbi:MAG TPA: rhodanese-like domain-containing protein [Pyrinomonadaceae bacterium]|jgi:rhodanese-related sulfurtransferase|nr:rhodanese-like domain-containing protein [Pyrinomonadaceae bacterium]
MQAREATRVTIDEIKQRMDRGEQFTFVDARNPQAWAEAGSKLPGAIRVPADEVEQHFSEISHDRTVITYCTCPHEASSAQVAEKLAEHGYKNVHPLFIGFEAWQKAGLPLEPK